MPLADFSEARHNFWSLKSVKMHITAHIKSQRSFCSSHAWGNWTWNWRWKSKVQSSSSSLWHTLIRMELHNRFNERKFVFLTGWEFQESIWRETPHWPWEDRSSAGALRQEPWILMRSHHTRGANSSLIFIVFAFLCGVSPQTPERMAFFSRPSRQLKTVPFGFCPQPRISVS